MEVGEGEQEAQGGLDLALVYGGTAPFRAACCAVFAPPDSGQNLCVTPYAEWY